MGAALEAGRRALDAGHFQQTRAQLAPALGRADAGEPAALRIDALLTLAAAERSLGEFDTASNHLQRARELAQQTGDPARRAAIELALGAGEHARGATAAAETWWDSALRSAHTAGEPGLEAAAQNDLGKLQVARGKAEEALLLFAESAANAQVAGDLEIEARASGNASRTASDPEQAAHWFARALKRGRALPDSSAKATVLLNLAEQAQQRADTRPAQGRSSLARAAELYTEALAVADAVGSDRMASYALGGLAEVHESADRPESALSLARRAAARARRAQAPDALYHWQGQAARLLAEQGSEDDALDAYERALRGVQGLQRRLRRSGGARDSTLSADFDQLHTALMDLLLAAAERAPPEREQALLRRARDQVEAHKADELRDYFRDDCVDALQARLATVESVSATARVVYPIPLPTRTVLLVGRPSGQLVQYRAPVGRVQLALEARALRERLEESGTRRYLPHAQQLYHWLVEPLEAEFRGGEVDTLVFVPDMALLPIPVGALHDGQHFLVERFAIAITPGLELTDPRPLDPTKLRALLAGLREEVGGFAALPGVAEEIAAVKEILSADLLLDADFRQSSLRTALEETPYGLLHLATHAEFSGEGDEAFLLAWDGPLSLDALAADVSLFRFRDTPLELLTLSACDTAAGEERAALGLSGVAVKTGARSALGTLWSVDDPATSALMRHFYGALLAPGGSRAAALRSAQRALIADFRYRHPAYWAPFQLIGNWL